MTGKESKPYEFLALLRKASAERRCVMLGKVPDDYIVVLGPTPYESQLKEIANKKEVEI